MIGVLKFHKILNPVSKFFNFQHAESDYLYFPRSTEEMIIEVARKLYQNLSGLQFAG
jgi:hypothetical protein